MTDEVDVFKTDSKIWFMDVVDTETVSECIRLIETELKEKVELIRMTNHFPFTLYISSDGGYISDGLVLYDYLGSNDKLILRTVGTGLIASMGSIIYLAGTKRYATKNSQFMFHELTGGTYGKYEDAKSQMKQLDTHNTQLRDIVKARTGLDEEKVDELFVRDTFLTAEEAKELNIVHEII